MALQPGKKRIERILLNFEHNVSAPTDYEVDAVRHLDHAGRDLDYFKATKDTLEVRTKLNFRVDQNNELNPMAFQPWVNQLKSTDPEKRREAARTLANVAPPSLENTLLTFADNPEIRQFAPLAFYRLNTPRSMAAMADLLRKAEPGTFEHIKSADYLAESGDQRWFPLLKWPARAGLHSITCLRRDLVLLMHRCFHRVLLFQFFQILSHGVMDLRCFPSMAIHSMASIPPSYYHGSAAIPIANHSDFFNTHEI